MRERSAAKDFLGSVKRKFYKFQKSKTVMTRKNLPKEYSLFHEDVRKILSGEYKFTCEVCDPKIPIPDDWSDKDKNWKGNIHYKNQKEPREEMIIKEIPINDMPEWFYEVYNFSLIPDSFWS